VSSSTDTNKELSGEQSQSKLVEQSSTIFFELYMSGKQIQLHRKGRGSLLAEN